MRQRSGRPGEGWLILGLLVILIAAGIYTAVLAPCDAIDWLPTRELPGRCLR